MTPNPKATTHSPSLSSDRFKNVCLHFTRIGDVQCRVGMRLGPDVFPLCCFFGSPECRHYKPPQSEPEMAQIHLRLRSRAAELIEVTQVHRCPVCQHRPLKDERATSGPHAGTGKVSCPACNWSTVVTIPSPPANDSRSTIKRINRPKLPPST